MTSAGLFADKHMKDRQQKLRWWALVVLGLGLLITIVDASVVNIAAPAIEQDYGASMIQVELVISAYTMVFAATLILFGKMGSRYGFRHFEMIGAGLFGLVAFPEWVRHRKSKGKVPIFDLDLFRYPSFRIGLETSLARQISQFALILTLAIFLQKGLGFSAWETGLVTLPAAIAGFIAGPLGGRAANRVGAKPVVILGIILQIVAAVVVMVILDPNVTGTALMVPVFIMGSGVALSAAQLTNEVLADVPQESAGDAGAANATVRQLGNSLATPMVGGLLAISVADSLVTGLLFSVIALVLSFTLPNVKPSGAGAPPGE